MRPLFVVMLVLLAGCGPGTRAAPAPAPPAVPASAFPAAPPVPPRAPPSTRETIRLCVMEDGLPREIPAEYDHRTGDTLVGGRPFAEVYPTTAEYARNAQWYVENELIALDGRRFVKYGLPRVLGPGQAVSLGRTYHGVPLYMQAGDDPPPNGILFVPVRPACAFQSYQWDLVGFGVRG